MTTEVRSPMVPDADELRRRRKWYFVALCVIFPLSIVLGIERAAEFIAAPSWAFLPLLDVLIWVGVFPLMWGQQLLKAYRAKKLADG